MSKRYPGGLITKTPVTPTTSSAPGVWTLEQALQYIKAGTWPLSVLSDPYFNYVTMLLHGDGTNGAQNNTFLDSSTNNFTITRNGNTTQGSFSPYGSNWSNYISASNYFNTTSSAALGMGTGDFTVEAWIFATAAFSGYNAIFADGFTSGSLYFGNTAGGFGLRAGSVGDILVTTAPSINQWVHVAVTRSGTTVRLFYNGVQQATTTNSTNFPTQSGYVGNDGGGAAFTGYISNLRIVKGTALYTSAFTPSTTPLTAISGTSLLTCQSNRFIDNSTNNFAITRNGTPSVQRFSPFSPTAAYSTSTIGGSGYFDGTGDYLTAATNSNIQIGATQDFTFEAWVYLNSLSNAAIFGMNSKNYLIVQSSTSIIFNGDVDPQLTFSGSALSVGTWYHIAVTRASGTVKCFVNGVQYGSSQSEASKTYFTQQSTLAIGAISNGSYIINGYIADVRVTKGAALYTTTFTPPTLPLTTTVSSGTAQFLTNFTNGGIFDNAMMNNLETVGDAQISTSVFKYGTGSLKFDGTGDWLTAPNSNGLYIGSGNFTIEGWLYLNALGSVKGIVSQFNSGGTGPGWTLYTKTTNVLEFYAGSGTVTVTGTTAISATTWTHFAVVRNGSTITIYINGTAGGTATNSSFSDDTAALVYIGGRADNAALSLNGYIDDLRITKGYARYTANFTPPTAAFPNN